MENQTTTFLYVLIAIIVVYYFISRYIWCDEQENFDPSLVPVSSIVTLAKVAQKLVDGNGTLTNPGNLTVTGNLQTNGNSTTNGQIRSLGNSGPFFYQNNGTLTDQLYFWNQGGGKMMIIGSTGTDYTWGQQVKLNGKTSTISCNNIESGFNGADSNTGNINIKANTTITGNATITGDIISANNIKTGTNGNTGYVFTETLNLTHSTTTGASNTQLVNDGAAGLKICDGYGNINGQLQCNNIKTIAGINFTGYITHNNKNSSFITYLSDDSSTGTPGNLEVHHYNSRDGQNWSGRPFSYSPAGDFRCTGNITMTPPAAYNWDYMYKYFNKEAINSGYNLQGSPNAIANNTWLNWDGYNGTDNSLLTGNGNTNHPRSIWICPTSGLWTISYFMEDGAYAHTGLVNTTQNILIASCSTTTTVPIYANEQLIAAGLWNNGMYSIGNGFLYFKLILKFN